MRSLTDMTKSLGRAASLKHGKRPSLSIDEPKPTPTVPAQTEPIAAPSPSMDIPTSIKPQQPVDDLLSIVDSLARPPSQDILRPFDSIPPSRASESKSMRGKKRRSVVGNLPPTVGKVESDATPFGDSFKSLMYEPEPEATSQHDHKPSTSPNSDGLTALMSSTTLSENSTSRSVSDHPHATTMKHASPSKDIGSYFKSLFTMKSRVSTYLKTETPGANANKAEADAPAGMHKSDPSSAKSASATDSKKGKNAKDLTIPVSSQTDGGLQNNVQLRPPASPNPSVKSGSIRSDPRTQLHPVAEEEAE